MLAEEVHHKEVRPRSLRLCRSPVTLRRVVLPMREVMPCYQDVQNHVLRTAEWTESLRDLVTTVRETQLNQQGNRLNMITKKVTAGPRSSPCPSRGPCQERVPADLRDPLRNVGGHR